MNLWCKIFGHWVGELSVGLAQARCGRCKRTYHASYDMSYGGTIFHDEVAPKKCVKTASI